MKKWRLWKQLLLDIFLAGVLICIFSYFHHVRILWGIGQTVGGNDHSAVIITKPPQIDNPDKVTNSDTNDPDLPITAPNTDRNPTDNPYGMFGKKFEDKFLADGEKVISTDSLYVSKNVRMEYSKNSTVIDNDKMEYFLIDIYVRDIENLTVNCDINKRLNFEELLTENTIAAISGDYCGNINASKEVLRNGVELRPSEEIIFDVGVLLWDGSFKCFSPSEYNRSDILAMAPYQIWNFGPSLLDRNGNIRNNFGVTYGEYITQKHPRQIFGYYEPGHYCFLTIEGRISESQGATFETAAKLVKSLGCTAAYNLDGGASAYTYYNGTMVRYSDQDKQSNPRKIYDIIAIVD